MPPRAAKGFNWIVRDCCFCALIRGLQNLGAPRKGTRFCYFLRRAKSNAKARQRFANLWTPGTIQSSAGSDFAKFSGGT